MTKSFRIVPLGHHMSDGHHRSVSLVAATVLLLSCCAPVRHSVDAHEQNSLTPVNGAHCLAGSKAVPCDDAAATTMELGSETWDRVESGWTRRDSAATDPDPTESITPLAHSAIVSVDVVNSPNDLCAMSCPGFTCPDFSFDSVVKAMPEVSSSERWIDRDDDCGMLRFQLEPVPLGPHLVATRTVRCACSCTRVDCWFESFREVYEVDPHKSILLSDTVTVTEALEIIALFRAGTVVNAPEDFFPPAILSGIYRNGPNFELDLAICGANALVQLEQHWGHKRLRYLKSLHGSGCA